MSGVLSELLIEFNGNNYEEFRSQVLLWDQSTNMRKEQRCALLLLKLKGPIHQHMLAKQDIFMNAAQCWWDWPTIRYSPGVKKFIEIMDVECRKCQTEIEFKDIIAFMRIRRHEHSLVEYILRFNMAKEKCFKHNRGQGPMFSDRVISSLLLETAQLPLSDRKVILGAINGDLNNTDGIIHQMRNVIIQASIHKEAHFMEDKKGGKEQSKLREKDILEHNRRMKKRSENIGIGKENAVSDCDTDNASIGKVQKAYVNMIKAKGKFNKQQRKWKKFNKKKGVKNGEKDDKENPGKNKVDRKTGKRMKCWICGSLDHMVPSCPKNYRNQQKQKQKAYITEQESDISGESDGPDSDDDDDDDDEDVTKGMFDTLFCDVQRTNMIDIFWNKNKINDGLEGTFVVDTGATGSMTSSKWIRSHDAWLKSMGKEAVEMKGGSASFRFGNNHINNSIGCADIPILVGGKWRVLKAHVFNRDCPNLLSISGIMELGGIVDTINGSLKMKNSKSEIKLIKSENGHLHLNVREQEQNSENDDEEVASNISTAPPSDEEKKLKVWRKTTSPRKTLMSLIHR